MTSNSKRPDSERVEKQNDSGSGSSACYLTVMSTDTQFMCRLIDWLNTAKCEKGTTVIDCRHPDSYRDDTPLDITGCEDER